MKNLIRILLVALSLGATGAYAANMAQAKYDSQSVQGDSANWGVGG